MSQHIEAIKQMAIAAGLTDAEVIYNEDNQTYYLNALAPLPEKVNRWRCISMSVSSYGPEIVSGIVLKSLIYLDVYSYLKQYGFLPEDAPKSIFGVMIKAKKEGRDYGELYREIVKGASNGG